MLTIRDNITTIAGVIVEVIINVELVEPEKSIVELACHSFSPFWFFVLLPTTIRYL